MSQKKEKKTVKVGQLTTGKDKEGNEFETVKLGNDKNKDPRYNYTVQIRVIDADGEIIYEGKNPYLNLYKPHANAPDFIKSDLVVSLKKD